MPKKIEIVGKDIATSTDQARRLFTDLGQPEPQEVPSSDGKPTHADPFTIAVGISSIILMVPSAIGATINLIDRAKRDIARKGVDDLKAVSHFCQSSVFICRTLVCPSPAMRFRQRDTRTLYSSKSSAKTLFDT